MRCFTLLLCVWLGAIFPACSAADAPAALDKQKRLIVVAPEMFHPALADYTAYKKKTVAAELHSLEKILRANPGVDDPEKLKRFLFKEWSERGLDFVLLAGDVDVLPVRYMVLDRVTPAAFDYSFYPSDLYYADLARADKTFDDWNAQKEGFHAGYFGEVRGEKNKGEPINYDAVDYRPEIAVGRWPVSTPDEARIVAGKTIRYEQDLRSRSPGAASRAALFAIGGWVDTRNRMDRYAGKLGHGWTIEKRYYGDARRGTNTPPASKDQVCQLLNEGVSLAIHAGHGEADRWDQSISVRDLKRITNGNALPVIVSAGCSTAYFAPLAPYGAYVDVSGKSHAGTDHKEVFKEPPPPPSPYQRGAFNPTGLGEQLVKRSPDGAVAYIGCNTGSQPCGLTLVDGFVAALSETKEPTLGECWASAVRYYYNTEKLADLKPDAGWYPPSIFFQAMKFMVFGDPSLPMPANLR